MDTFQYQIEVAATETGPFAPISVVVDTGATYSWFPRSLLSTLGVTARGRRSFLLADGRFIEREIAVVAVRLDGQVLPTICAVGDEGTTPLLGAFTLEGFGLAADPVSRRLVPLPHLYLLPASSAIPYHSRRSASQ